MAKWITLIIWLAAMQTGSAQITQRPAGRIALRFSPQHLAEQTGQIGLEYFWGQWQHSLSGIVAASQIRKQVLHEDGSAFEVQYRHYLQGLRPYHRYSRGIFGGWYAGAFYRYGAYTRREQGSGGIPSFDQRLQQHTWGLMGGYQRILHDCLSIDLHAGFGYRTPTSLEGQFVPNPHLLQRDYQGWLPRVGLTLGLLF